MIKKQQMRWNRWTVQPFLDVRVAVLNKTLGGSFKRLYPDFQPDNENHAVRARSVTNPTTLHALHFRLAEWVDQGVGPIADISVSRR